MIYVEAPEEWSPREYIPHEGGAYGVFLAGGITDCPDWQSELVGMLDDANVVLLNPRRQDFPIGDPDAAEEQIEWEHVHLRRAEALVFWFCAATLCPIVLYELGAWSMTAKPMVIGIEPGYERSGDVRIQTALARPGVAIVDNLHAIASWVRGFGRD